MKFYYKAETLEKVIDIACDDINIDPEYLYYNVLNDGSDGKDVEIEAYTLTDVINYCEDYLLDIIKDFGLEGSTTSKLSEGIIKVTINSNHNSILIGKNGNTLRALNDIVRLASSSYFKRRFRILLDINEYKDEKYDKIVRIAKSIAKEVQKTHITAKLQAMSSDERRVVHNALSYMHNIRTESTGTGLNRAVQVIYCEDKADDNKEDL